jgi:hypothetical protein
VNNDGAVDVLGGTSDGLLIAYDSHGKPIPGFPLQAGAGKLSLAVTVSESVPGSIRTILAAASSDDGTLSAWQIGEPSGAQPVIAWSQFQHDGRHSGIDLRQVSGRPLTSEFFPPARAYNWPNPTYDGKTFIRYYVRDNATIAIKIFDLAGDLVAELSGKGTGGMDNEIEWDAKDVQSGIYFARIEATGTGRSGVAIIKVAIVK